MSTYISTYWSEQAFYFIKESGWYRSIDPIIVFAIWEAEGVTDPYDRFYNWLLAKGFSREQAESETATFMETVADLMD